MEEQIRAEMCHICNGRGIKSNGQICDNCRGIGMYGTDGTNEYFLQDDGRGGLVIADTKGAVSPQTPSSQTTQPSTKQQKKQSGVLKGLLFILLIILYSGFIGIYISWINQPKVFWLVTLIAIGLLFLFVLYDARIVNALVKILTKIVLSEPDDFLTYLQKVKSSSTKYRY